MYIFGNTTDKTGNPEFPISNMGETTSVSRFHGGLNYDYYYSRLFKFPASGNRETRTLLPRRNDESLLGRSEANHIRGGNPQDFERNSRGIRERRRRYPIPTSLGVRGLYRVG